MKQQESADILVFKSPQGHCCDLWVAHLRQQGFKVYVSPQEHHAGGPREIPSIQGLGRLPHRTGRWLHHRRAQEEVARLIEDIREVADIPMINLGITGSILLGIHDPSFSDIDLMVYGREAINQLRTAVTESHISGTSPLDESFLGSWRQEIAEHHSLTDQEVHWLVARRWNFMYYGQGRYLSLHPVRSDAEIQEVYGEHYYRDAGVVKLLAIVSDAADSIFLPAIYGIEQVKILEGPIVEIREICSYEGLFSQAADVGQEVEARGKLERLDGSPLHRLVIGSSHRTGTEYLKPVHL